MVSRAVDPWSKEVDMAVLNVLCLTFLVDVIRSFLCSFSLLPEPSPGQVRAGRGDLGSMDSMVDRGPNHGGMDGVVIAVTPIRVGSHNNEGSSSDESLHFCSIGV